MKKYPLAQLLDIFELRLNQARLNYAQAERSAKLAWDRVNESKETLRKYKLWWPKEERKIFNQVIGKILDQKAFDKLKSKEKEFRAHQVALQVHLDDCQKAAQQADEDKKKALDKLHRISVRVEKFDQHRKFWKAEQMLKAERMSEKEDEEFQFRRRDSWYEMSLNSH